ncbi:D-alanine--D-alanine ligase family protein [Lacisediminihabitans sp.]|uniref:D-alanine--D-alanine ligase family protein n=1 Tax=Lacisediminihabitans sp. TaxID=2787631 RepID=UPI002F950CFB
MKTIGIIFGGANSEHEVSCASAMHVLANLDADLFVGVPFGIDRRGGWHRLASVDDLEGAGEGTRFPDLDGIDVVFPVLHGRFGEDGTVQGMLELAGVPYVGCGVLASALAMDKKLAQRLLEASGVPTIPTHSVTAATAGEATALAADLGYPLFVKPNRSGSSVGVSQVQSPAELDAAIALALEHDTTALIQKAVEGDEVDLGVLQLVNGDLTIGAPLRVVKKGHSAFFDYASKYTEGAVELEVPARIPEEITERLVALARLAFTTLSCDGLARVDFFVGRDGTLTLNEVNTLPGLTALSHYPRMWPPVGISYTELLTKLIDRAGVAA